MRESGHAPQLHSAGVSGGCSIDCRSEQCAGERGRGITEFGLAVLHGPGLMAGDAVTRLSDSEWIAE